MNKQRVFELARNDVWIPVSLRRLQTLINDQVLAITKRNRPEYLSWDSIHWLIDAITSVHDDLNDHRAEQALIEQFTSAWTHVRGYHGCRTADVGSYYENGIVSFSRDGYRSLAHAQFGKFCDESAIDAVVDNLNLPYREGLVYFVFDDESLKTSSHYLQHGAEILQYVGVELGLPRRLHTQSGCPTVFVCDVPKLMMSKDTIEHLAKETVVATVKHLLEQFEGEIDTFGGFSIPHDLPRDCIVSHYQVDCLEESGFHVRTEN